MLEIKSVSDISSDLVHLKIAIRTGISIVYTITCTNIRLSKKKTFNLVTNISVTTSVSKMMIYIQSLRENKMWNFTMFLALNVVHNEFLLMFLPGYCSSCHSNQLSESDHSISIYQSKFHNSWHANTRCFFDGLRASICVVPFCKLFSSLLRLQ